MTSNAESRSLLMQDCDVLGIRWDSLQLTGCDAPRGGQGSTLSTNGMEAHASRI
jgi:hypothetical protein